MFEIWLLLLLLSASVSLVPLSASAIVYSIPFHLAYFSCHPKTLISCQKVLQIFDKKKKITCNDSYCEWRMCGEMQKWLVLDAYRIYILMFEIFFFFFDCVYVESLLHFTNDSLSLFFYTQFLSV